MASLTPDELAYQKSHAYEDHSHQLGAFYIVVIVLSACASIARISSRRMTSGGVCADDYVCLVGIFLSICSFIVLCIYAWDAGLGKHWATLTPAQMAMFTKLNYAYNILNVCCYPIVKISIILLYRRVFPNRRFQQATWAVMGFITAVLVATTLVDIFPCRPVHAFYDMTVTPKYCIDDIQFYLAQAALNILTDLFVIALPIPMIRKLQTTLRERIEVSVLFMIGGLSIIVSIMRIPYYLKFDPHDPSYSFTASGYLSAAEVCLGIIVACAATYRPLVESIISKSSSNTPSSPLSHLYSPRSARTVDSSSTELTKQSSRNPSSPSMSVHKFWAPLTGVAMEGVPYGPSHHSMAEVEKRETVAGPKLVDVRVLNKKGSEGNDLEAQSLASPTSPEAPS